MTIKLVTTLALTLLISTAGFCFDTIPVPEIACVSDHQGTISVNTVTGEYQFDVAGQVGSGSGTFQYFGNLYYFIFQGSGPTSNVYVNYYYRRNTGIADVSVRNDAGQLVLSARINDNDDRDCFGVPSLYPAFQIESITATLIGPRTYRFSSTANEEIVGWFWSFGDGSAQDNSGEPAHQYSVPGTYTVGLIAVYAGETASKTLTLNVTDLPPPPDDPPNNPPVISISTDRVKGRAGVTLFNFTAIVSDPDPGGSIIAVLWEFGDGTITTGNLTQVSHVYQSPGLYAVTATAFDNKNATAVAVTTVKVRAPR